MTQTNLCEDLKYAPATHHAHSPLQPCHCMRSHSWKQHRWLSPSGGHVLLKRSSWCPEVSWHPLTAKIHKSRIIYLQTAPVTKTKKLILKAVLPSSAPVMVWRAYTVSTCDEVHIAMNGALTPDMSTSTGPHLYLVTLQEPVRGEHSNYKANLQHQRMLYFFL